MTAPQDSRPLLSVVIPVLDEAAGLPELRRRLNEQLGQIDGPTEVIYVDDGSTDHSAALVESYIADGDQAVLLVLSRNFGMDIAMSAGLDEARGEYVTVMHADLQDPPELIPQMLAAAREGADVVYARRIGRDESRMKRALATAFYRIMERLARVPYQGQAGDFRMMSRRVVEDIRRMPERRRFLRGMVAWVGYEQVPIEYRRAGRAQGRGSSYPQLIRLALEALTSFSDVPLSLVGYAGVLTSVLSALAAFVLLVLTIVGVLTASGYIWVLIAVLFLSGIQLMSVGVLGRYLARVHEEALERPLYLVDRVVRPR
ncbi:MAG: glycosyltransferase family 2 protein [Thermoleophilaceae bacterium]